MKHFILVVLLAIIFGAAFGAPAVKAAQEACNKCQACASMCESKLAEFQKKGGKYADPKRITLMKDCISICKTNDGFRKRKSDFRPQTDKVCAEVCKRCAESCEELKDPSLKGCIEMCRTCADNCKAGG